MWSYQEEQKPVSEERTLAQSEDEELTPEMVKEALKQMPKATVENEKVVPEVAEEKKSENDEAVVRAPHIPKVSE